LVGQRRLAHLDEIAIGATKLLFSDSEDAMRRSPSANLSRDAARAREQHPEIHPPPPLRSEHPMSGDLVSLRRFYALCRMLSAEADLKQLSADATHGLFSLCPAEWVVLCRWDAASHFVELERAGREKPPDDLGPFPPLFGVAVESKTSTFQASREGAVQLVVPLVHADRVSGVFWIGFEKKEIEIGPIIELLGTYASFVAMALKALA
jgi:hypothetical protein